jgi:chorismate synthase
MTKLSYLTSGESHGPQLSGIIEGVPAGITIDIEKINFQLQRRQKGYGRGGRMEIEKDKIEVTSGLRNSVTLGSPITLVIKNNDYKNWLKIMNPVEPVPDNLNIKEKRLAFETTKPRPGHADLSGGIKYGHHDFRNVLERASARETAMRVALGSLVRQLLEQFDIQFASHVVSIGDVTLPDDYKTGDIEKIVSLSENSEVRCIDSKIEQKMISAIKSAKKAKDSLGGVVELIVNGLPVGLGTYSQPEKRLDSRLAGILMAIPSVKGVEIGLGFRSASKQGSDVHDEILYNKDSYKRKKDFYRETNNAGGIEGGITNGEDLVLRVASKPLSTLNKPLKTVDVKTKEPTTAMVERTDHCIVPALAVVCEATAALVLGDAFLDKFGGDSLVELKRNYQTFLDSSFI